MPMFIIAGSMMRQAISAPRSSKRRSSATASLNGTTSIQRWASLTRPLETGALAGRSRPPITSALGITENITASWWPW